jgi:hypothetical protein
MNKPNGSSTPSWGRLFKQRAKFIHLSAMIAPSGLRRWRDEDGVVHEISGPPGVVKPGQTRKVGNRIFGHKVFPQGSKKAVQRLNKLIGVKPAPANVAVLGEAL